MSHLYVCHFSNGHIKVGRSVNPMTRIAQHEQRISCLGIELVEHFIAECVGSVVHAEAALIKECTERAAKRNKNEWFEGLDYTEVCDIAKELSLTDFKRKQRRPFPEPELGPFSSAMVRNKLHFFAVKDLQALSDASGIPFTTLLKIKNGVTSNPGIDTVNQFIGLIDSVTSKQPA